MSARPLAALALAALLGGCATAGIDNYDGEVTATPDSKGERRMWFAAERLEEAIHNSDAVLRDPELTGYVQGIMDRLFPEFAGTLRVHVLKTPVVNAFALPNGGIYLHTGLLAAMANEAQLATVLAHEGIHFTHKHSVKQRANAKVAEALVIGVNLAGIPLVSEVLAIGAMSGYSRAYEAEADRDGWQRLATAGYATAEAPRAFHALAVEAKARDEQPPFLLATHPKLEQRIANFSARNSAEGSADGDVLADAYEARVGSLRREVLAAKVRSGDYDAVIAVLEDASLAPLYGSGRGYWLGEAYRLRGGAGDLETAWQVYSNAHADGLDSPELHFAMGVVALKTLRKDAARQHLTTCIDKAPETEHALFAQQYLDTL